jgi:thiosulfate reductase cytochrome b subunit
MSVTAIIEDRHDTRAPKIKGPLIYRQPVWTRITHWLWAIALLMLLLTGLNIFNARPQLYVGQESGFEYNNTIFQIGAERGPNGEPRGFMQLFDWKLDTTGHFGVYEVNDRQVFRAIPGWMTIPSYYDLGTARVVHFFFGWVFVATIVVWFVVSFFSGHVWRDIVPKPRDLAGLPRDMVRHASFRFEHGRSYGPLQKLSYFTVFFILFPLIVLTGLSMSPTMNASWPWLLDLFGGRQTARTIHFAVMALLVVFFVVHVLMVVLAGPINELRSIVTGWYRAAPGTPLRSEREEQRNG